MKLDIDIAAATGPGRRRQPVSAEIEREITQADIAMLATYEESAPEFEVKKLTDRHHMLARLIAGGMSEADAAIATSYTASRISVLKSSPAFQELIAFYRDEVNERFVGVLDQMAGLTYDAIIELRERLEDTPEDFAVKDLLSIASDLADRTGAPKQREVKTELTVNLGDRLAAARERAKIAMQRHINSTSVIDAEYSVDD